MVFVVDDRPELRQIYKKIIEAASYKTEIFPNGQSVLSRIAAGYLPDLLLTDVEMPGLSGVDLVDRIKRFHPIIPTILMSGELEPIEHKADAFLQKPIKITDLIKMIELKLVS